MSRMLLRLVKPTRFNQVVAQQSPRGFSASMQPMTADNRPNILSDIKRDHAQFFGLHRRFKEELNLSDHDKQLIIWQARRCVPCCLWSEVSEQHPDEQLHPCVCVPPTCS
jgi:hypothetical protein